MKGSKESSLFQLDDLQRRVPVPFDRYAKIWVQYADMNKRDEEFPHS